MAFQACAPFFGFLRSVAGGTILAEAAPAENYILDERISPVRQAAFLRHGGFDAAVPGTVADWFQEHKNYTVASVARAAESVTFADENRPAWLTLEPDWDVVRIETLEGLCDRATGSMIAPGEVEQLVAELLADRSGRQPMTADRRAALNKWLRQVNGGRDRRPAFVAAFAEVEPILNEADWANRLRDALGLGHIRGTAGRPATILLVQYNLERVQRTHAAKSAWAATPTVLDDVATAGPNACFFPAPLSNSDGYGFTVDLAEVNASWKREFLHARIDYTLDDIRRIGKVDTEVTVARIEQARADHRDLLINDLTYFSDLPPRP